MFPNKRTELFFINEIKKQAKENIWLPEMMTMEGLVNSWSTLNIIDNVPLLISLYKEYRALGGDESFDQFLGTGQTLLKDFNEIDINLVEPDAFFKALVALKLMSVWSPDQKDNDLLIKYWKFWDLLEKLFFQFREKLLKENKAYSGLAYRQVCDNIDELAKNLEWEKIIFIGFSFFNKSEEFIINKLNKSGKLRLYWDTDSYYLDNKIQEAGNFIRDYKDQFKFKEWNWKTDKIKEKTRKIEIIGAAKQVGQTLVASEILQSKLSINKEDSSETCIILNDEALLGSVLHHLPQEIEDVNVTMGMPFKQSILFTLIRSILDMHENIEDMGLNKGKEITYYHKDIINILSHQYVSFFANADLNINSVINDINGKNKIFINESELEALVKDDIYKKFVFYSKTDESLFKSLEALIECLFDKLTELSRAEDNKDYQLDLEYVFRCRNQLFQIRDQFDTIGFDLELKTVRKLIMEALSYLTLPLKGEPLKGLQIMGLLESRALSFKNVIMLSCNEGYLPSGKRQNSFIPFELRKQYLSTYKHRESIFAYLFYRLIQDAENIYYVYNTEADDFGSGERSRFLTQLINELPVQNPETTIQESLFAQPPKLKVDAVEISILKDDLSINALKERAAGNGFSPSALNTYINCSLQYYFRYIAKIQESDEVSETIEADIFG
ncbi:PD-(D/E)XK nuclease family protein, partial [Bacteroidales bacterium AH-315-N07]|nr:PD-(D/E)XK nuclease family protein [Bacteroidales bacterium AH-315-N07]